MSEQSFNLRIVSLQKTEVMQAVWLEVETPRGSFVFLPGHFPIVSQLRKNGEITFKDANGAIGSIKVPGGLFFAENGSSVSIVIWN